ncbi:hypothetical protein [Nocardiopsis sinuspersici]|uniref:hypothetical protein n=1 Tax=Nocardiopsis sinuspersici TaxID=501010 RepID=UPI0037440C1B
MCHIPVERLRQAAERGGVEHNDDNLHYVDAKGNPVTHIPEDGTTVHRSDDYSFRDSDISEEEWNRHSKSSA